MSRTIWIILVLLPPLSWILCRAVLSYTQKKAILDIPNDRSSHTIAKPRGGGLAVVISFLLFVLIMFLTKAIPLGLFLALCGGGTLIAYIGWLDDKKKGIPLILRLLVQLVAACWALYWLGGFPRLRIGNMYIHLGIWGTLLAMIGVVWATNLYNFMDGIDGIAASEAISIGVFVGFLLLLTRAGSLAALCFALALSSLGFLVWNWPPSKIFMGDVGSTFFGFIFGSMVIFSENTSQIPALVWILLLGVFIVDSTATLIRRICHGEPWYKGHRTHAFQCMTQMGYSHRQVTLFVLYLNIILAILAFIMWTIPSISLLLLGFAFLGLLVLYILIYARYKPLTVLKSRELIAVTKENKPAKGISPYELEANKEEQVIIND